MTGRNRGYERGVSLVELLLALAVTAMMMVPVVTMLDTTVAAGAFTGTRRTLEQDASFALDRIATQVRATPRKTLAPNASPSDSETWFAARYSQKASQLIERVSGFDYVIADAVSSFSITARAVGTDNTLVETSLVLQRGEEVASATAVVRLGGAP